jgi:hypothetical protein
VDGRDDIQLINTVARYLRFAVKSSEGSTFLEATMRPFQIDGQDGWVVVIIRPIPSRHMAQRSRAKRQLDWIACTRREAKLYLDLTVR